MESGSLLADALRYMQQIHQNEKQLPFDVLDNGNDEESKGNNDSSNSIVFSLYCIDEEYESCYRRDGADCNESEMKDKSKVLKQLHQRLAYIHTIIHGNLKPLYQKRYAHTWFTGGEGMSFGMHCATNNGNKISGCNDDYDVQGKIPHLKAVVQYGPHTVDLEYALAIILNLSRDLYYQYQINTAISCWDVDDGQILLIEGADSIPDWVDDVIGVEGMANRVYVVSGNIQILDPSIKSNLSYDHVSNPGNDRSIYNLTLKESLLSTMSKIKIDDHEKEMNAIGLNDAIQKWLEPFLRITNINTMDPMSKRQLLKTHIHTAAIVLPLRIALLMQQRPDLVPCSILKFCTKAPDQLEQKRKKKTNDNNKNNNMQSSSSDGQCSIHYENLVFTTITISKSLYAMLLTAAGQIPPPIKVPKRYKSLELNRIKRQCLLGGEGYAHFRHAIEIGLRLTLGFEWILNDGHKGALNAGKHNTSNSDNRWSIESRISYHSSIGNEVGGDGGKWIKAAWVAGPNSTTDENDISNIVKCPVWNPEISNGGICPLTHCGMSVYTHITNALRTVDKKDLHAINTAELFPFPRMDDVDSDSWIDMNSIDELEEKMSEMTTGIAMKGNKQREGKVPVVNLNEMENMMSGLDTFVNNESEIEGVVTAFKGTTETETQKDFDLSKISPKVFLTIMHKVLKAKTLEETSDFSDMSEDISSTANDSELLQYFTRDDLDLIGDDNTDTKQFDPASMEEIMNAMDQELLGEEDVDRTFKVPNVGTAAGNTEKNLNADGNNVELPFDHPTVMQSNVISNLLESLDAQNGRSGPVSNLMKEIGMKPPGEI